MGQMRAPHARAITAESISRQTPVPALFASRVHAAKEPVIVLMRLSSNY